VIAVMNLRVPSMENYRVAAQLVASRVVLSSLQLVLSDVCELYDFFLHEKGGARQMWCETVARGMR
jgi:hypothetical protein